MAAIFEQSMKRLTAMAVAAGPAHAGMFGTSLESSVDSLHSDSNSGSDHEARPSVLTSDDLFFSTLRYCLARWHVGRDG